jgi:hypothetical protein
VLFIASGILVRYYSNKDKHNGGPESPSASPSNPSPYYDSGDRMTMYTAAMEDAPKKAPSNLYPIQEYSQGIDHNSPVSEKSFTEFHARPLNASSIYTDYPTAKTMERLEDGNANLRMDPHRESVLSESRMYVVSPTPSPYSMPSNPSHVIPPPPTQGPHYGLEQRSG